MAARAGVGESDVVVVGGGPAGMCAAVEAARAGASVVVLESLDRLGGNGAISGGYIAFLGSDPQREAGVDDSEDLFVADMVKELDPYRDDFGTIFDEDLARQYIRGSADAYRFLVDLGFRFSRFIERPRTHSALRLLALEHPGRFKEQFLPLFEEFGIAVHYRSRAERFVMEDGRIAGVVYRDRDSDDVQAVRARSGVVLATGGFQAGLDLRLRYQPERRARGPYMGVDTCDGQGHIMGQSVGADLINMAFIQSIVIVGSYLLEDCIAVNAVGRRFHDETCPVRERVGALSQQPDERAYYVFDDRTARQKAALVAGVPGQHLAAGSLRELAEQMGCDPAALEQSAAEWNAVVASDIRDGDPFGRRILPLETAGISEAPFHAAPMIIGVMLTAGGFRVTPHMQVLDVYGDPIPNLFAAGDCLGGILPAGAMGGIHLGSAVVFGRAAGAAAANGKAAT